MPDAKCQMPNVKRQMPKAKSQMPDAKRQKPSPAPNRSFLGMNLFYAGELAVVNGIEQQFKCAVRLGAMLHPKA